MTAYTLFGQPATPATLAADNANYVMGVQFTVTLTAGQTADLDGIWFYSPPGAGVRPDLIDLWAVSGAALVTSQAAAWSGGAGAGWIFASFTSPPVLASATAYKAAIRKNDGGVSNFYGLTSLWWSSGPGGSGISSGPLAAPNNAGGDGGQDTFESSGLNAYPATSFNASNYWVDPQVTVTSPAAGPAPAAGGEYRRSKLIRELIW